MSKTYVYLAGPIAGLTEGEAKDWRADFEWMVYDHLHRKNYTRPHRFVKRLHGEIVCVSPLRCEPAIDGRYDLPGGKATADPKFGTANAIAAKNEFDTRRCDIVVAFLPKWANDRRPSLGTVIEMALAFAVNKQVILVTDDDYYLNHPLVQMVTGWRLRTLEEAADVVVGVMEVYS